MNAPTHTNVPMQERSPDWPLPASGWSSGKVLVVGAGESGVAMAEWFLAQGAAVRLIDSRPQTDACRTLPEAVRDRLELQLSQTLPFSADLLSGCSLLALSPGLTPHAEKNNSLSLLISEALRLGITQVGELDLFDWSLAHLARLSSDLDGPSLALHGHKVLAITGTNGKTTTARLTAHLLRHVGLDVQEAGNQGPSLLRGFLDRQASGQWPDVWVLELSSFQLALAHRFVCSAATILNLTQDHLDWHIDMQDYRDAKLRIFGLPSVNARPIVDIDDTALAHAVLEHQAERLRPSESKPARQGRRAGHTEPQTPVRFGLSEPHALGPSLGLVYQGIDWLAYRAASEELPLQRLMPTAALKIQGRHNLRNAMAALGLALTVSDDLAGMLHALRHYAGEPHRMQWVTAIDGISFVNDSKGTNVGATVAALTGTEGPIILILGGQGKGQDFSPLINALVARQASVVGIGQDGAALVTQCQQAGLLATYCADLSVAVEQAWHWARAAQHDVSTQVMILLSPACASFDMFKNYEDRGHQFVALVHERAQQEGQLC